MVSIEYKYCFFTVPSSRQTLGWDKKPGQVDLWTEDTSFELFAAWILLLVRHLIFMIRLMKIVSNTNNNVRRIYGPRSISSIEDHLTCCCCCFSIVCFDIRVNILFLDLKMKTQTGKQQHFKKKNCTKETKTGRRMCRAIFHLRRCTMPKKINLNPWPQMMLTLFKFFQNFY